MEINKDKNVEGYKIEKNGRELIVAKYIKPVNGIVAEFKIKCLAKDFQKKKEVELI